eukprot:4092172-Pleurochrysis_carterae.AAC.1
MRLAKQGCEFGCGWWGGRGRVRSKVCMASRRLAATRGVARFHPCARARARALACASRSSARMKPKCSFATTTTPRSRRSSAFRSSCTRHARTAPSRSRTHSCTLTCKGAIQYEFDVCSLASPNGPPKIEDSNLVCEGEGNARASEHRAEVRP